MEINEMTKPEFEYFDMLCQKFEIQVSSTGAFRDYLKKIRLALEEQKKLLESELIEKQRYVNDLEKLVGRLEKGDFRK